LIENFLRRPRGLVEVGADVLRALAAVSVIVAAVLFDLTDAGVIAFTLPGVVAPRFLGMRAWVDISLTTVLLVAAWSNVFELYTSLVGWDLVVHFICGGFLAAVLYLLLAQLRIVPVPAASSFTPAGGIILTTTLGLALSALWEVIEWLGYAYISTDIYVSYDDTIGDLVAGGTGALAAGIIVAFVPLLRTEASAE